MGLVLSQLPLRPPALWIPCMARPMGEYFAAVLIIETPYLRPLPIAPATPVLCSHSRPLWATPPTVSPALCMAQEAACPAPCTTSLMPCLTRPAALAAA